VNDVTRARVHVLIPCLCTMFPAATAADAAAAVACTVNNLLSEIRTEPAQRT